MTPFAIFALTIIELLSKSLPGYHVYLGLKPSLSLTEPARTFCGIKPDGSHVFIIDISHSALTLNAFELKQLAAHEICHILRHEKIICNKDRIMRLTPEEILDLEREANNCALALLSP